LVLGNSRGKGRWREISPDGEQGQGLTVGGGSSKGLSSLQDITVIQTIMRSIAMPHSLARIIKDFIIVRCVSKITKLTYRLLKLWVNWLIDRWSGRTRKKHIKEQFLSENILSLSRREYFSNKLYWSVKLMVFLYLIFK